MIFSIIQQAGFIGYTEVILIVLIVLLLFGGRKIPELMKGLGKGIREFKEGMRDGDNNNNQKQQNTPKDS